MFYNSQKKMSVIQVDNLVAPQLGHFLHIARCTAPTPISPLEIANKAYVDAGDSDARAYADAQGGGGAPPAYITNSITALRAEPQVVSQSTGNFTATFSVGVQTPVQVLYRYTKAGNLVYLNIGTFTATIVADDPSLIATSAAAVPEIIRPSGTPAKFACPPPFIPEQRIFLLGLS